jgi:cytochrome c biogenesis protein CcmG, thiol:disulfide interchange protein DsbE
MNRFWPLAIFVALVGFLYVGLHRDPREVPSPLVGKPAPAFALTRLDNPSKTITRDQLLGHVYMLNVWASWCVSCRDEHPILVEYVRNHPVEIYGLDYKDTRPEALAWLDQLGNPYQAALFDADGRVGMDYGVYGVPETFIIDKKGVVRYKQIGPINPEVMTHTLAPMIERLQKES